MKRLEKEPSEATQTEISTTFSKFCFNFGHECDIDEDCEGDENTFIIKRTTFHLKRL
jgi:hypothetical protein